MRFLWCAPSLLLLLADVNCGLAEELFISFKDPTGDQDIVHDLPIVAVDIVRVDLSFSNSTGDYNIRVFSDAARPFDGSCRINILLFNPDAGTTLDPGFFGSHREVLLESPDNTVTLSGTSSHLIAWQRGHRVGIGTAAFGNPSDAPFSLFGSAVLQSVDNSYTEWKSIDYIGQDGGNNGQSTAIAIIVPDRPVIVRVLADGHVSWRARHVVGTNAESAFAVPTPTTTSQRAAAADGSTRSSPPGLLWFTLGLFAALGLTFIVGWISYDFVDRGPVVMRSEWGGRIHMYDNVVDAFTGFLIAAVGWIAGLIGLRRKLNRPLTLGFILGTTLLGIFFALPGK